jgi:hypothetical protein
MNAKRALAGFRAPDEHGAEDRAWEVVRSAYRESIPVERRPSYRRRAGVFAAGLVLAGAVALSPAGATVGRLITRALGVQHATPALFSLPAPGRVLVAGPGGTWTVAANGSARRLGPWTQASWSPRGLYVAVARGDELAAVDPHGNLQWTLARRDVRDPRWYPPTGYRVAYLSGTELREVAGDGTGDHLLAPRVAPIAPAWRPAHPYQLAYATPGGGVVVRDADTGQTLWSAHVGAPISELLWSSDGQRLLAVSGAGLTAYTGAGAVTSRVAVARATPPVAVALAPDGRTLAVVLGGSASQVLIENVDHPRTARRVLAGAGLGRAAWSPDGKWLLVSWPAANQWVFIHARGAARIMAASRIAQQLGGGHRFPRLEGWCCDPAGSPG